MKTIEFYSCSINLDTGEIKREKCWNSSIHYNLLMCNGSTVDYDDIGNIVTGYSLDSQHHADELVREKCVEFIGKFSRALGALNLGLHPSENRDTIQP